MTVFKEFREFAARGNVIDLAVGVVIGTAFGRIITSAVNDIIMPPIGMLLGQVDFTEFFLAMDGGDYASLEAARTAGAPILAYGFFVNTVVEFLIVAAAVFLMVRQINRLKTPESAPPADERRDCPFCVSRIPRNATRCAFCTAAVEAV